MRLTDGNRDSSAPAISADGQHVAFASDAWNLVPGDDNSDPDVFIWDRPSGATTLVSEGMSGGHPEISSDGRFVTYIGRVTEDDWADVFLWDRDTGTRTNVTEGEGWSGVPTISANGRFVAFESGAPNLVANDDNGVRDIFVWDAATGTTTRITDGDGASEWAAISQDGRYVAFNSDATNLTPGDDNGATDVFVWDATSGTTTRITDGNGWSVIPRISGTGRYVTYMSAATDLTPDDATEVGGVFVWDASTGETRRVSDGEGSASPEISADGRYITYQAYDSYLVPGEGNGHNDVYAWDVTTGETRRITSGNGHSHTPVISGDASAIAFQSHASDLVDGDADANGVADTFLWARDG